MTQLITLRMLLVPPILLAMAAGCTSTDYDKQAYDFDPGRSRTRAILDAQHATGAAADASLNRHHFEDGRLNGLGRDKLDWMLAARGESLVVYVDVRGSEAEVNAMVQAVRAYLAAGGVSVSEEMVVAGASLDRTAAAARLADRRRLEGRGVDNVGSAQSDVMASQQADLFGGQ